jgi:hypothetical protein
MLVVWGTRKPEGADGALRNHRGMQPPETAQRRCSMRTRLAMVMVLAVLLTFTAVAGEKTKSVTLEGNIACAKCTLGMEGATDCQSVLVVKGKKDKEPMYYYLVKNDVTEEYGHVCQGEKAAIVTGDLMEKDGKMWLTATKMEKPA